MHLCIHMLYLALRSTKAITTKCSKTYKTHILEAQHGFQIQKTVYLVPLSKVTLISTITISCLSLSMLLTCFLPEGFFQWLRPMYELPILGLLCIQRIEIDSLLHNWTDLYFIIAIYNCRGSYGALTSQPR